ncbi:hypothetical protein VTH8203_02755 [Vibrio thalassae]|uniref:Uncharacterized protein n=1 Tax=Vibrio thalassae TaxID=1243014 RepID=A0A240EKB6_9VIBR|nr:hypothetical protein [Vibrio thalassae]SNX49118.1 hypothetical protein VTH8203_02755 [Vibrio thalassae]
MSKLMFLNILKKNLKYYAAQTKKGDNCRVLIDEFSENLSIGEQTLLVDDISVRTRSYGTDLKFKISSDNKSCPQIGTTSLKSEYNSILVQLCRNIGGTWDDEEQAWIFPYRFRQDVEELDVIFNSQPVTIELTAIVDIYEKGTEVHFLGKPLCKSINYSSGPRPMPGVWILTGYILPKVAGSNCTTHIPKGSTLQLKVPSELLDRYNDPRFDVRIIG